MSDVERYPPLAFVDLETTGMTPARHRVLEIAIVTVDGDRVTEWSTLVNPGHPVPAFTRAFTGISDAMIAAAPRFGEIAPDVERRLRGRLFIAHNARFDHGFLRAEFRRLAIDFRPPVLCTVKLSRRLYPAFRRHDLDTLMARHGLNADPRHRALPDAQLIWQFWDKLHRSLPASALGDAIDAQLAVRALPRQLDRAIVDGVPESPGAYVFYGEQGTPLYVGKATNLSLHIRAQLSADDEEGGVDHALRRLVTDIEWHATSGVLGARLKAAALVKALLPAMNRRCGDDRPLFSWRLTPHADVTIAELTPMALAPGAGADLFGMYPSQRKAANALRKLAGAHSLCFSLLGLKSAVAGKPHLSCRVAGCDGECTQTALRRLHVARFIAAAAPIRIRPWPYAGAIGIREGRSLLVVDEWRYIGTADSEDAIAALLEKSLPAFDAAVFKILTRWLATCPRRLIVELAPVQQRSGMQRRECAAIRQPPDRATRL